MKTYDLIYNQLKMSRMEELILCMSGSSFMQHNGIYRLETNNIYENFGNYKQTCGFIL